MIPKEKEKNEEGDEKWTLASGESAGRNLL